MAQEEADGGFADEMDNEFLDPAFFGDLDAELSEPSEVMEDAVEEGDASSSVKPASLGQGKISVQFREEMSYHLPASKDSFFYELRDSEKTMYPWINALSVHLQADYFSSKRHIGIYIDNSIYIYFRGKMDDSTDVDIFLANNLREGYVEINPIDWWSMRLGKLDLRYGHSHLPSPVDYLMRYFIQGQGLYREQPRTGHYAFQNIFYLPWLSLSLTYLPDFNTDLEEFSENDAHALHIAMQLNVFSDFNPSILFFMKSGEYRFGLTTSGGIGNDIILYTDISAILFPKSSPFIRKQGEKSIPLGNGDPVRLGLYNIDDLRGMEEAGFEGSLGITYTPAALFTILFELRGNSTALRPSEWDSLSDELEALQKDYKHINTTLRKNFGKNLPRSLDDLLNSYSLLLGGGHGMFQPALFTPLLITMSMFRENILQHSRQNMSFSIDITYLVFDYSFVVGGKFEWNINENFLLSIQGEYSHGKKGSMISSLLYPARIFVGCGLEF